MVGKLNWMHVPATVTLTSIGCNPNLERIAHVRALQDEILSKGEAATHARHRLAHAGAPRRETSPPDDRTGAPTTSRIPLTNPTPLARRVVLCR